MFQAQSRGQFASVFPPSQQDYSQSLFERLENFATVNFDTIIDDSPRNHINLADDEAVSLVRIWLSSDDDRTYPDRLDEALTCILSNRTLEQHLCFWYTSRVTRRFEQDVLPQIKSLVELAHGKATAEQIFRQLDLLEQTQAHAIRHFDSWLADLEHGTKTHVMPRKVPSGSPSVSLRRFMLDWRQTLLQDIQRAMSHSIPIMTLIRFMHEHLSSLTASESSSLPVKGARVLQKLRDVGVAETGQQALAYATFAIINSYVNSYDMKVDWMGRASVTSILDHWITSQLEPAVRACQAVLADQTCIGTSDRRLWSEMALDALGRSRTAHLLRYVQMWDQSMGAILDLKVFIRSPEAKRFVVSSFVDQMRRDLLHAGVQTSELLTIYINIIRAFKIMDGRNVLLGKVAEPLRSFLTNREDTVQVIAASFLVDSADIQPSDDICVELAHEVARCAQAEEPSDRKTLDWDDMEWLPDPIDAGPDFERSKRDDIISYMLRLSDPERFYDKIRRLLCNRLLKSDSADTDFETRLVELLKSRRELDKDKLTECEVMLRDMQESKRLLKTIQRNNQAPPTAHEVYIAIGDGIEFAALLTMFKHRLGGTGDESGVRAFCDLANRLGVRDEATKKIFRRPRRDIMTPPPAGSPNAISLESKPDFSAKVLSSVFWPTLRDAQFVIPGPAARVQSVYESTYLRFKSMRRLRWLSAQGRATVELHLEDRDLTFENIHAWQASVIYAFGSEIRTGSDQDDPTRVEPVSKTRSELGQQLEMDDVLLSNALDFWVSKRVLIERAGDTFSVLENLADDEHRGAEFDTLGAHGADTASNAAADNDLGAAQSQSALLEGNRLLYETCIVHMLTNGGSMDSSRMAMMLQMVVPGGFEFGDDGVRSLCAGLVETGRLVQEGDAFKVKK